MNNLNQKRIVWMMDETIANTHPRNWQRVRQLDCELVKTIGSPMFRHELVDPIPCLRGIVAQLREKDFSCVLDLTGWLTPAMKELFPNAPVENRFSLSRVRVVSSPRLETTGYRISMFPEEIEQAKKELDLSHPLIVDDVSFSGWTSRKTMELWGLDPQKTTHAFLIANTGNLGPDLGAVPMLTLMGNRVVFGHELITPNEDGWHLKDLYQNPNLSEAFLISMLFQKALLRGGRESNLVLKFFANDSVIRTIFPDHVTSPQIRQLVSEGRFILRNNGVINGDEIHARNPFLWASLYFQEHLDIEKILEARGHIVPLLSELQALTTDPEGKDEAAKELRNEVRRIQLKGPEGNMTRERER